MPSGNHTHAHDHHYHYHHRHHHHNQQTTTRPNKRIKIANIQFSFYNPAFKHCASDLGIMCFATVCVKCMSHVAWSKTGPLKSCTYEECVFIFFLIYVVFKYIWLKSRCLLKSCPDRIASERVNPFVHCDSLLEDNYHRLLSSWSTTLQSHQEKMDLMAIAKHTKSVIVI